MTLNDASFTKPHEHESWKSTPAENAPPRAPMLTLPSEDGVPPVAEDPATRAVLERVMRLAGSELPVLFTGEDGAGKGTFAAWLHAQSRCGHRALVRVSCLGATEAQLEVELFGIERGPDARPGALESADGGTILIEHLNALPLSFEPRLIHVLEFGQVYRHGSITPRHARARFLATARRRPEGRDLVRRLAGAVVDVPPIRSRSGDIEPLARRFLAASRSRSSPPPSESGPVQRIRPDFALRSSPSELELTEDAVRALRAYDWPGNAGEVRLAVERGVVSSNDGRIQVADLDLPMRAADSGTALHDAVELLERQRIESALAASGGNRSKAARALGIARNTLLARLKAYGA
jgi:DNA-binding NtrC family response regulator